MIWWAIARPIATPAQKTIAKALTKAMGLGITVASFRVRAHTAVLSRL